MTRHLQACEISDFAVVDLGDMVLWSLHTYWWWSHLTIRQSFTTWDHAFITLSLADQSHSPSLDPLFCNVGGWDENHEMFVEFSFRFRNS